MDDYLKTRLQEIHKKLNETLGLVQKINEENFDNIFPEVKLNSENLAFLREELIKKYKLEELKNFNKYFEEIIKKINSEFDNKLTILRQRQSEVAEELKSSINQKKLFTYR